MHFRDVYLQVFHCLCWYDIYCSDNRQMGWQVVVRNLILKSVLVQFTHAQLKFLKSSLWEFFVTENIK